MLRTEAALRYAYPELFINSTNERETSAEIVANHIIEKAFFFFREPSRTRKEVADFTNSIGIVLESVAEDGLLPDVVKQLESKGSFGPIKYIHEVHTANEYHCIVRVPEDPDKKAKFLFAIQIIPANCYTNGDHTHEEPRRSEAMYSLSGQLRVCLHEQKGGEVIEEIVLKPGDFIFIDPNQAHSVKSSPVDSINIVVGMPLKEDEFIPQAA